MKNDLNNYCRLCLTTNKAEFLNLFVERGGDTNIAAVITQHFWFEVKEDDGYKYICKECWLKVDDFHSFYTRVFNVHDELSAKVHQMVKLEINVDGSEQLDDRNLPNCKNELFEVINNVTNDNANECSSRDSSDMDDADIIHDSNTSTDEVSNIRLNKHVKTKVDNSPKIQQTDLSHDCTSDDYNMAKPNSKKSRIIIQPKKSVRADDDNGAEPKTDEANKQIQEYLAIDCELCATRCDTFTNLKLHYRKVHKTNGYLRCCNRKYTKRSLLVDHIQWHLNPEIFKCNICDKSFSRKGSLQEHSKLHLMEEDNFFKCSECSKSFTKKSILENHLSTHSKEKNFICNDCGKSFRTNFLLLSHTKNIHNEVVISICDVCAKEFRNKAAFEQHKKTHQNIVLPKVKCHICGIWLKSVCLKNHLVLHEDSKVEHFCSICGKQSRNRKALYKHIKSVHSDKVYKCILCEKTFKKEISLKEHMPAHTGGTLYFCPHCPKTFNSSSNMYSHKKKVHVKEREEHERLKAAGVL